MIGRLCLFAVGLLATASTARGDYAAIVNGHAPVAYWRLGESLGAVAVDQTGLHSGAYQNAVSLGQPGALADESDTAADFAGGAEDRVQVAAFDVSGSALTMTAWFNADAFGDIRFVSKASGTAESDHYWMLGLNSSSQLKVRIRAGGSTTSYEPSVSGLAPGAWHFIAATYDGTTIRVYLDGDEVGTTSKSGSLDSGAIASIGLANQPSGAGDRAFDGRLDEIAVFDKALTTAEIEELYNEGRVLIAHWSMDEGSGVTVADATDFGNDATFDNGTPIWTTGVLGNALEFDGNSDVRTDANFDPPEIGSVAFWYRSAATPTGTERLLGATGDWEIHTRADGTIFCDLAGSTSGSFSTGTGALSPGTWRHLAAIYNTVDDTYQLYLDGTFVSSGAFNSEDESATRFALGTRNGSSQRFNGALDDVRVYNYELTATEVASLFTAPGALVGHWRLDDNSGATATDSSVIVNDGTLANSPAWVSGKHGTAIEFDGADDYVEIPHHDSYLADEGTVTFWFRADTVSGEEGLFSKDSSDFDTGGHLTISRDGDDVAVRMQSTSSSYTIRASNIVAIGQWHFVAFQWGPDGMRLLVDNVEADTDTYAGGLGSTSGGTGNYEPIAIGASTTYSDDLSLSGIRDYFDGAIDDVRFYSYRLSDLELEGLFTAIEGLIAHWKFDEGAGTTIADATEFDNDASFATGTPEWIEGVRGYALRFDGTNDAQTDADFDPPATGAVAFWYRRDGSLSDQERPFGTGGDWEARQEIGGRMAFDLGASPYVGSEVFDTTSVAPDIGRWRHLVAQFDADTDAFEVYVDGVLDASGTNTRNMVEQAAARLSFGARTGSSQRFNGALDDFRVYNRWLTAAEIANLYGLVGYWKLDETTGTTAYDSSGADHHLTHTGVPSWAVGVEGGAAEFDSSIGYFTNNSISNDLNGSDGIAAAMWVRSDVVNEDRDLLFGATPNGDDNDFSLRYDKAGWGGGGEDIFKASMRSDLGVGQIEGEDHEQSTEWTHVAFSWRSGDPLKLWVGGVRQTASFEFYPAGGEITGVTQLLVGNGTKNKNWDGLLDEVRVYNRAISDDEARTLFYGEWTPGLRIIRWVEIANP